MTTCHLRSAIGCLLLATVAGASFSGTDLYLPMVGRNPGLSPSQW